MHLTLYFITASAAKQKRKKKRTRGRGGGGCSACRERQRDRRAQRGRASIGLREVWLQRRKGRVERKGEKERKEKEESKRWPFYLLFILIHILRRALDDHLKLDFLYLTEI
jgi:hypothetical protein